MDYLVKIKPAQTRLSGQYWIGANSAIPNCVPTLACSLDEAQRNPGDSRTRVPDSISFPPGYNLTNDKLNRPAQTPSLPQEFDPTKPPDPPRRA